jgi:hypothetical protein
LRTLPAHQISPEKIERLVRAATQLYQAIERSTASQAAVTGPTLSTSEVTPQNAPEIILKALDVMNADCVYHTGYPLGFLDLNSADITQSTRILSKLKDYRSHSYRRSVSG